MKNPNGNILKDNLLQQIQEYYDYQEKNNFVSLENKFGLGLYQGNKLLNTFEILDTEIIYQSDHQIFFKMFKQGIRIKIFKRLNYQLIKDMNKHILFWNKEQLKLRNYSLIVNILKAFHQENQINQVKELN
ncbi:unnamed protein product [Paramecium sonneborni]|uniref:Uncharacterized protein n=1 Tax=Paramecium sonneborni TaxID=65129 RepID=A0A8S1R217_9CILI|nr:unnamed protein product [Paramecium sonneborni]